MFSGGVAKDLSMASGRVAAPVTLAAESSRSRLDRLSFRGVFGLLGFVAIALLIAPTVIVVITSFTNGFSLKFPPPGYSTRWYQALWDQSPEILAAAWVSLKVAVMATLIATLLAVAAAIALAKNRSSWARVLESIFMSPLMLPTLALGLALLMTFNLAHQPLSMMTLVIGHIAITTPYILRTTIVSYTQLDPALLESATSLGASAWHAFRTVTLPLIAPGIVAGAFIESSLDVRAAAVSGVLIAATVVLMLVMERVAGISKHIR
jgi:putative spermidine/putrescine transport system permease protein